MSYVNQVINPETNKVIVVGGKVYNSLVTRGVLPKREMVVIDGKKSISIDKGLTPKKAQFASREEKQDALRKLKAKEDQEKKARKAKVRESFELESMRKELERQTAKKKLYKQQLTLPKTKDIETKPKHKVKKEEYYESTASSSSS